MSRRISLWAVLLASLTMTACLEPRGPNRTWMNQTSEVVPVSGDSYASFEFETESIWRE